MKIAVGPNSHGNEVFERLVIDDKGNLLRVAYATKLKPGWTEAETADVDTAIKAANDRAEQERKVAEEVHKENRERAVAQLPPSGPLLSRTREGANVAALAGQAPLGQDVRPVGASNTELLTPGTPETSKRSSK